jgi:hypothetical protein
MMGFVVLGPDRKGFWIPTEYKSAGLEDFRNVVVDLDWNGNLNNIRYLKKLPTILYVNSDQIDPPECTREELKTSLEEARDKLKAELKEIDERLNSI